MSQTLNQTLESFEKQFEDISQQLELKEIPLQQCHTFVLNKGCSAVTPPKGKDLFIFISAFESSIKAPNARQTF